MPIQSCTLPNGKSGWKWGSSGKCYASRADAEKQAAAIRASGYEKSFTANSVHSPTAIGNDDNPKGGKKKDVKNTKPDDQKFEIIVNVDKRNDEQQIVYGWASVTHENGTIVTDLQNDRMEILELQKGVHEFMLNSRIVGHMHVDIGGGAVVDSIVFTPEVQEALGIELGKSGWFVGAKVHDPVVWECCKRDEGDPWFEEHGLKKLKAFSIGGSARREEILDGSEA